MRESVIDGLVGHAPKSTRTRHYAAVSMDEMREAVDLLPATDWAAPTAAAPVGLKTLMSEFQPVVAAMRQISWPIDDEALASAVAGEGFFELSVFMLEAGRVEALRECVSALSDEGQQLLAARVDALLVALLPGVWAQ